VIKFNFYDKIFLNSNFFRAAKDLKKAAKAAKKPPPPPPSKVKVNIYFYFILLADHFSFFFLFRNNLRKYKPNLYNKRLLLVLVENVNYYTCTTINKKNN